MPYYDIPQVRAPQVVTRNREARALEANIEARKLGNQQMQYDLDSALPANEVMDAKRAEVARAEAIGKRAAQQWKLQTDSEVKRATTEADLGAVYEYERVFKETGDPTQAQAAAEYYDTRMEDKLRKQFAELAEVPTTPFDYVSTLTFLKAAGVYDPAAATMAAREAAAKTGKAEAEAVSAQAKAAVDADSSVLEATRDKRIAEASSARAKAVKDLADAQFENDPITRLRRIHTAEVALQNADESLRRAKALADQAEINTRLLEEKASPAAMEHQRRLDEAKIEAQKALATWREASAASAASGGGKTQGERFAATIKAGVEAVEQGLALDVGEQSDMTTALTKMTAEKSKAVTTASGQTMVAKWREVPPVWQPLADALGIPHGISTDVVSVADLVNTQQLHQATTNLQDMRDLKDGIAEIRRIALEIPEAFSLTGDAQAKFAAAKEMAGGDPKFLAKLQEGRSQLDFWETRMTTKVKAQVDTGPFAKSDWELAENFTGVAGWLDTPTNAMFKMKELERASNSTISRSMETYRMAGFETAINESTGQYFYRPKTFRGPDDEGWEMLPGQASYTGVGAP